MPLGTVLGAGPALQSATGQPVVEAGWLRPGPAYASITEPDYWATTFPIPPRAGVAAGWPLPPQPPLPRPHGTVAIDEP